MDFGRLDEDQTNVIRWSPGGKNLRVVAAAGSGKTTTIAALVTKLVLVDEVRPSDICVLTFANRAGQELKNRLSEALGAQIVKEMFVGTFHGIGLQMLRRSDEERWSMKNCADMAPSTRSPNIPSTMEFWRSAVVFGKMPGTGEESLKAADYPDHHLRAASLQRAEGRDWTRAKGSGTAPKFTECWAMVERAKKAKGAWEFDDVLLEWNAMLDPDGPGMFKIVVVDEAQDNNKVQGDIVRGLAGNDGNIVFVGDLRQTIHEWRGAHPRLFQSADKKLKAETRELRFNYRSTPSIVELCNGYASGKQWTLGSDVSAVSTSQEVSVRWKASPDPFVQAVSIANEVAAEIRSGVSRTRAVLLRTNGQIAIFEALMLAAGVSVNLMGGRSALRSYAARTIQNYLKAINEDCAESLSQVLNTPKRYLPRTYGQALIQTPTQNYETLAQRVARVARSSRLKRGSMRGAMELSYFLESARSAAWKAQPQLILDLIIEHWNDAGEAHETDGLGVLQAVATMASKFDSYAEFAKFWKQQQSSLAGSEVTLSTIHRAKGLEWDHVYVDATGGFLPHHRASASQESEEERLLYVAMSRAKTALTLTWSEMGPTPECGGLTPLLERFRPEKDVPDSDPNNGAEIDELSWDDRTNA
jgi:superfamily I DNA/RNA helicase